MIKYIKTIVTKDENYHIKNFDGKIETNFTKKIMDYSYKNILDAFLEKGITFDLAIQLTDEVIKEYRGEKEKDE